MAVSDGLAIETLGPGDIHAGLLLSSEAGWNQTAEDWRHFIEKGRTLGVRDEAGRLIATAAALPYLGPFGFLGMVLVTEVWRRRGIASRLVSETARALADLGLTPALDATAAGAEVYRKQGFLPHFAFDRWQGETLRVQSAGTSPVPDAAALVAADEAAFGARRPALMSDFLSRPETVAIGEAGGFGMIRRGRRAWQLGPVVAQSETDASRLMERLLSAVHGPVFVDVPSVRTKLASHLASRGFSIQRSFTRMALGRSEPFGDPGRLFAIAGPEFG